MLCSKSSKSHLKHHLYDWRIKMKVDIKDFLLDICHPQDMGGRDCTIIHDGHSTREWSDKWIYLLLSNLSHWWWKPSLFNNLIFGSQHLAHLSLITPIHRAFPFIKEINRNNKTNLLLVSCSQVIKYNNAREFDVYGFKSCSGIWSDMVNNFIENMVWLPKFNERVYFIHRGQSLCLSFRQKSRWYFGGARVSAQRTANMQFQFLHVVTHAVSLN